MHFSFILVVLFSNVGSLIDFFIVVLVWEFQAT